MRNIIGIAIGFFIGVSVLLLALVVFMSPDITALSVKYQGDTEEGVVLDESNEGIILTGYDDKDKSYDLSGWTVEELATLEADSSSTITIRYEDMSIDLTVDCTTTRVESMDITYVGETKEGTVIDDENRDFEIVGHCVNGTEIDITEGWSIKEAVTLEADTTSEVTIVYEDLEEAVEITCSTSHIDKIKASYDGETGEGVSLDEKNEGIHVTAVLKNGKENELKGWTVKKAKKLKAGTSTTIKIEYKEYSCELKVDCSTMSEKQYKDKCKTVSYEKLARNPDDHKGEMIKFTGEVIQVLESDGLVQLRIDVTKKGSYYTDTVFVIYSYEDGESKLLEDDIVTFYGTSGGLMSYEAVSGAEITIPMVYAKYITLN